MVTRISMKAGTGQIENIVKLLQTSSLNYTIAMPFVSKFELFTPNCLPIRSDTKFEKFYKNGGVVLVDEADLCSSEVLKLFDFYEKNNHFPEWLTEEEPHENFNLILLTRINGGK